MIISQLIAKKKSKAIDYIPMVLDLGQSNSGGRGEAERLGYIGLTKTPENCFIYTKTNYTATKGVWENVQAGYNTCEAQYNHHSTYKWIGAETSLMPLIRDRLNKPVYYLKCAYGGAPLADTSTFSWATTATGELYDVFRYNFFNNAISDLPSEILSQIKIIAIIWHQGESDASSESSRLAYYDNFKTLITGIRNHNQLITNVPVFMTKLKFAQTTGETYINNVFQTIENENNFNAYCIDISDLPKKNELTTAQKYEYTAPLGDDNHSSYLSQVGKGQRIYNKMIELNLI